MRAPFAKKLARSELDRNLPKAYAHGAMIFRRLIPMLALLWSCPMVSAVDVVLSGGVALKSWEKLRGPVAHDNWWANFIRAATVHIDIVQQKRPDAKITWIVFRPAYISRGKEEGKDYVSMIKEQAAKRKVKLVFVDTAAQAYAAINQAPSNKEKITSFYYFGHSNAHAFMLDYSNTIIGSSKHWIHEKDLATRLKPSAFAPNARCYSYGCYTGLSMSQEWKKAIGLPLWGNTESTRYQPVGDGCMPTGNGRWVQ